MLNIEIGDLIYWPAQRNNGYSSVGYVIQKMKKNSKRIYTIRFYDTDTVESWPLSEIKDWEKDILIIKVKK